ncbi:MAG: hypothetical protein PVJ80_02515 [Gemmatimonadota bacterium]|jgi:hypothetical protein
MRKLLGAVALALMLVAPGTVQAQAQTVVGGLVGYHDDAEALGVGAYASFAVPQLHENLSIMPSFVYYFPDGYDAWELNGDVSYSFPVSSDSPVIPVAFAGLNIFRTSVSAGGFSASSTDVGLNLGGAVVFPLESVRPSAGAKFELQDGTSFVIFGGIGFPLG